MLMLDALSVSVCVASAVLHLNMRCNDVKTVWIFTHLYIRVH